MDLLVRLATLAAQSKEAEAKRKEAEAKNVRPKSYARKRMHGIRGLKTIGRRKEAQRRDDAARKREEVRRKGDVGQQDVLDEDKERKKREIEQKEAELKKRVDVLFTHRTGSSSGTGGSCSSS